MAAKMLARSLAPAALAAIALAALAHAQTLPTPSHDYRAAPAGSYAIDPKHTSVIARVPHLGFSYSVFRFTGVTGALGWNPADPHADTLTVSVDPTSIVTGPVPGFSQELDQKYLKAAAFPTITFTATAFRPVSATRGVVEGDLSLMGVTHHVSFDADLIGAGKEFRGPVIGVSARTTLDPKTYGLPPFITGPIQLYIDTEFDRQD